MPAGPQTLKQAKAAFKARGQTPITTSEQRQLARGAELLRRAERAKEQEKRKKELCRKQNEKDQKDKQILLGTQRKLDKFGYKSSQRHLGNFLKTAVPVPEQVAVAEPWDADDVDDDLLLASPDIARTVKHTADAVCSLGTTREGGQATSLTTSDLLAGLDCFLDSSTQIARELYSENQPTPRRSVRTRISSFNLDDMDAITEDDVAALEAGLKLHCQRPTTMPLESRSELDSMIMPPPELPSLPILQDRSSMDRRLMPPPRMLPVARRVPVQIASKPVKDLVHYGISAADLESLAADDIMLSQFPP